MKNSARRVPLAAFVCVLFTILPAKLTAAEDAGELVNFVVGLLGDADKDVRALAFEQVRSSAKGSEATKVFAAQLPKLSPEAQVGLLSALAARGDGAARPAVLELLSASEAEPVRAAAVEALGPLGNSADLALLVSLLEDPSKSVQVATKRSLVVIRGDAVGSALAARIEKAASPVSVTIIDTLVKRRALDTIPTILPAALHSDQTVRMAAMKALGQIAGPDHVSGMVQGVLKAKDSRERAAAEKNVMFVCARIEDPEKRAEPLLAAIDKLPKSDQPKMLSTLGRVGGSDALKIVEAAIADDDKKTHETGLKALCNWPDASVAARLTELAANDDHPSHRISALRALIRIAPLRDKRTDAQRLEILRKAMIMATRDTERTLALDRARAIRTPESLRFILPYVDKPDFAEQACLSIVELAHHRTLREPNKAEFHAALDKVIQTSKDATVVDRAQRYKKDQTWVRPKKK